MMRLLRFALVCMLSVTIGAVAVIVGLVVNVAHAAELRCPQPVGYMLDMPTGPAWQLDTWAIQDAVAMLSAYTGQLYRFDGYTTWQPSAATIDQAPDDLVIDVDTPWRVDLLTIEPGAAGYTIWTPTHAVIALDAERLEAMSNGLDLAGGLTTLTLTEHELGHSVGLNDTTDPAAIMDPFFTGNGWTYTANERDQLAATGCRP